jgi:hypothetical protein
MPLHFATKDAGRPHVIKATAKIVDRYIAGEPITSIDLPPRSGKTSVIHLSALELHELAAPWTLAIAPWAVLPDQTSDPEKVKQTLKRYCSGLPKKVFTVDRVKHVTYRFYERETTDILFLFCATLPLVFQSEDKAILAIEDTLERFQKRPVIMIDEAHLTSSENDWGQFVEKAVKAGAYVVVLTGTSIRRDGKPVPGFEVKFDDKWIERQHRLRSQQVDPTTGEVRHFIDTYDVQSREGIQKADEGITWQEAWEKGYLNKLNILWADAELETRGGYRGLLSEMPAEVANKHIRQIVEAEKVIREAVRLGVNRLHAWRVDLELAQTKMLVTTGADLDRAKEDNYHARMVKRELTDAIAFKFKKDAGANVRVEIATTTLEDDDGAANKKIKAFRGDKNAIAEIGEIDVLIVKSMGLVGLDVEELKVQICLSTLREGPMMLQERSRCLTVWDTCAGRPSDMILPYDAANKSIVEKMRKAGGVRETTSTKVASEEIEPTLPPEKSVTVTDTWLSHVSDHEGHGEDFSDDDDIIVRVVRRTYPSTRSLTDVIIVRLQRDGAFPACDQEIHDEVIDQAFGEADEPRVTRLEDETERLRGRFGEKSKQAVSQVYDYNTVPEQWRKALRFLQEGAKRRAGVNVPVTTVDDPAVLQRLIDAIDQEFYTTYSRTLI